MENRFEHTPEEKQDWGKYATPPPIPGQKAEQGPAQSAQRPILPNDHSMCSRFLEQLPMLMENGDGELNPDTVKALYGHLSVCGACSTAFDEHQRLSAVLHAMPTLELPMDFTGIIQRRIQVQAVAAQTEAVVSAVPTRAFGNPVVTDPSIVKKRVLNTTAATAATTLNKTKITATRQLTQVENGTMQRLTAGAILSAVMASFVSSEWGREMLGNNITVVRSWLDQVGAVLSRIPVLGRLAILVFTALSQVGDLLGDTYRTVGDMAVRGLAMDIGVCIAAYYFLVVRKQQRDNFGMRRV